MFARFDHLTFEETDFIRKTMSDLPVAISEEIDELSEIGNECYDDGDYDGAIAVWKEALQLIPEPTHTYAESQWLETSIGDAYFLQQEDAVALDYFLRAKRNIEENAYQNPFLLLRLGQTHLDAGQLEDATEYLIRAYMMEGEELFEEEDDRYFEFLKTRVDI